MHDGICSLAIDKKVAMVIIPFHRHWAVHGGMDELPGSVRSANRNIMRNAPCSVGILIDRGTFMGTSSLSSKSLYSIGVIFAEGPDEREALAYVLRMGDHPNITMIGKKHHIFREEVVSDSVGTVAVIRSLGLIGDMLASTDSKCHTSVLVVQQQTFASELIGKDKFLFKDSCVVLDIPQNSGKVWPELK
ncbi:hypothetical protein SLA2020_521300 [Shorea laevis]